MSSSSEIDQILESMGFMSGALASQRVSRSISSVLSPGAMVSTLPDLAPLSTQPHPPEAAREIPRKTVPATAAMGGMSGADRSIFQTGRFFPIAPESLQDAGLHLTEVSDLIIKFLAVRGMESGYNIARQVGMRFPLIESVLRQLKVERLVSYKNSAAGGDYLYEPTDHGRDRARSLCEQSTYMGTAPVPLDQYVASVRAQSLAGSKPPLAAIRHAFSDLELGEKLLSRLGQAIHAGRGMFLYGPAGNGKTSIAERVTKSFGDTIWIPRSISAAGEIIRLYDPNRHQLTQSNSGDSEALDGRWVQIERPTIVAGGELQMENLEITYIRRAGAGEAPLQLKSNCGTLLIDDFGRQRMSIDQLLNRWIVPLEQRYDYLHLESGRSIQVPFDQMIIFSSNLEPRDLVDDAFLRRIPYKIQVENPTAHQFRELFRSLAAKLGFRHDESVIDYLIETHYVQANRTLRFCHPRDLLRQMENRCSLHELNKELTCEAVDEAVSNYFSIM